MSKRSSASARLLFCLALFTLSIPINALAATPHVESGDSHGVALATDGTVWTWGNNSSGQLCDGTRPALDPIPKPIPALTDVVAIAAGFNQTFAVTSDGQLWACGSNNLGELGTGSDVPSIVTTITATTVTDADTSLGSDAIGVGLDHLLVIRNTGTVAGFGYNWWGQLGDGTTGNTNLTGTSVVSLTGTPAAVAAGDRHSLILTTDGQVHAMGSNSDGQLGIGADSPTPATIGTLSGIQSIRAGLNHSMALTTGGDVYSWGDNKYGQLGTGNQSNVSAPLLVVLSGVKYISTNLTHSLAVKDDLSLLGWGTDSLETVGGAFKANARGTLGQNDSGTVSNNKFAPHDLTADTLTNWGSNILSVQAGKLHTFAVLIDETIVSVGENGEEQLGDTMATQDFVTDPTHCVWDDVNSVCLSLYQCSGPDTDLDGYADSCDACINNASTAVNGTEIPGSIHNAYLTMAGGETLQLQLLQEYREDVTFDNGTTITFKGDYDCPRTSVLGGQTVIKGIITVETGTVTFDNIVIM